MNPSEIKKVLHELGGWTTKRLGQHFLINDSALRAIVETADIQLNDLILEIGPGLGVLTRALQEKGARVIAIEKDRRFAEYLKSQQITLVQGDATKLDWSALLDQPSWKFVSNLPYNITSFALRQALWNKNPPQKMVVLIQREVAERAVAKDEKTSLLSLMISFSSSQAHIVKRIPPGAFYPPPRVESAILEITPLSWKERQQKWGIDPNQIMIVAKRGFAHPRKLLTSNLGLTDPSLFTKIGIAPKVRAEDVTPSQWAELAHLL